jgi:hypothetical protein
MFESAACDNIKYNYYFGHFPSTCLVSNTVSETGPVSFIRFLLGWARYKKLLAAMMTGTESISETSEQAEDDGQFFHVDSAMKMEEVRSSEARQHGVITQKIH